MDVEGTGMSQDKILVTYYVSSRSGTEGSGLLAVGMNFINKKWDRSI